MTTSRVPVTITVMVLLAGLHASADPVIELRPISASGAHAIDGNQITLDEPGQRVFLEVFIADWDPNHIGIPRLAGFQASLDSSGYSSGTLGTLVTATEPCDPDVECPDGACVNFFCDAGGNAGQLCNANAECEAAFGPRAACGYTSHPGECAPGFQDATRSDWILGGVDGFGALDLGTPNIRWGGVVVGGGVFDTGAVKYAGTLVLDVPLGTIGTFTLGFNPEPASELQDTSLLAISPLEFVAATILVTCGLDADCDDGDACTNDSCRPNGACLNEPNFNELTSCCDPVDGSVTLISDGNECTLDRCDADTGTVTHEIRVDESCGDATQTECDDPDTCDAVGVCQDNRKATGTACGDGTNNDCTAPDTCDDAGACAPNNDPVGTLCADGSSTDCTAPDTCDGLGTCLDNHAEDGTSCDDAFCTLDQTCLTGLCTGGTPNLCDDDLTCTIDTCDEALDLCENTLRAEACLIDDVCRSIGELNPLNDCQECDPSSASESWSFQLSGAACDDGDPCTGTGRPEIGIDTCDGAGTCSGLLDVDCNDNCEFAVEVFEGINTGANVNQGPDDVEVSCQSDSNNDVWFVYTAGCDGLLFASTTGSLFTPSNDPVLSVHDACPSVAGSSELACDDDSGAGLQAALSFTTQAGVSYWFRVAGFEDNTGDVRLNISTVNDCLIDDACHAEGAINPANECETCIPQVSTTTWSPRPEGASCGSPVDTECDSPDACDGAGVCEANPKPDGTVCSDDGNECTFDECLAGLCSHPPVAAGEPCGDLSDSQCDHPNTCDGASGCLDNFEPFDTPCGDSSTDQCNGADICDGVGACDNNFVATGTPCDDTNICTGPDLCQSGLCEGPFIPVAPLVEGFGGRYVRVTPQPAGSAAPVSLRVTSPTWGCLDKYIRSDGRLVTAPVVRLPEAWDSVFIHGIAITPDADYVVQAECGGVLTPGTSATTPIWGDTVGFFENGAWLPPDGMVAIADILAIIEGFAHAPSAPRVERIDLVGCDPDGSINIDDVLAGVEGFSAIPFSCPPPCP